jgi:hypothetical protein
MLPIPQVRERFFLIARAILIIAVAILIIAIAILIDSESDPDHSDGNSDLDSWVEDTWVFGGKNKVPGSRDNRCPS